MLVAEATFISDFEFTVGHSSGDKTAFHANRKRKIDTSLHGLLTPKQSPSVARLYPVASRGKFSRQRDPFANFIAGDLATVPRYPDY